LVGPRSGPIRVQVDATEVLVLLPRSVISHGIPPEVCEWRLLPTLAASGGGHEQYQRHAADSASPRS
jgi:hypothetical protein